MSSPGPAKSSPAVLAWVAGLGFGLPCLYAISYLAKHGRVWTFLGFPTYGGGPFEDIGIRTTVPLLSTFVLVCAAELVAGWMLWHGNTGVQAIYSHWRYYHSSSRSGSAFCCHSDLWWDWRARSS